MKKKLLAILMTSIITVSNVNAIFANQLSENLIEQTYSSSITSSRKSNDEIFQQELGGVYVTKNLYDADETCFIYKAKNPPFYGVQFWYKDGTTPEIHLRVVNSKGKTVEEKNVGKGYITSFGASSLADGEEYSLYISDCYPYGKSSVTICYSTK